MNDIDSIFNKCNSNLPISYLFKLKKWIKECQKNKIDLSQHSFSIKTEKNKSKGSLIKKHPVHSFLDEYDYSDQEVNVYLLVSNNNQNLYFLIGEENSFNSSEVAEFKILEEVLNIFCQNLICQNLK